MPHIRVKSGLNEGNTVPLGDKEIVIGRDPACDIPLNIQSPASRRHAAIAPNGGGWVIRDLGSVNGTLCNGDKVTEAPLAPGDEIAIGDAVFVFEDGATSTATSPARSARRGARRSIILRRCRNSCAQ